MCIRDRCEGGPRGSAGDALRRRHGIRAGKVPVTHSKTTQTPPLRVGYKASAEQFAPLELGRYAVRAEELGLDSVTVSDHFQPWRLQGGHAPNALAWMPWVLSLIHI